jgi:hypothetical protein
LAHMRGSREVVVGEIDRVNLVESTYCGYP